MRLFSLDARLAAVADKIPEGLRVWDVGSDHARLPVWLVATGKIPSAVASDIGEQPLASARRTVERFGVGDRVSLRLCDGIPPDARGAADVFIIAGLGGSTIADILLAAPWTQEPGVRLVLQPMSSPEDTRKVLYEGRWRVTGETFVRDGHRRYVVIEAEGGGERESFDRADLAAGKHIRDPEHIARAIECLTNELGGADEAARRELTASVEKLEAVLREEKQSGERFWTALDALVSESEIVIDRPKGSAHPRFPDMIYPLDYGYLKGTSSMDGGGIDVFVGSAGGRSPDAVAVILDMMKRDSEIKILLGCTAEEKETVLHFLNDKMMSAVLIERE